MPDTKLFKAKNNESGTITQLLSVSEVNTLYLTPVPAYAPGVIVLEIGTSKEEHIYYKSRDAGAGTVSGLTRDYTNLNGGVGQQHENNAVWETSQASEYINNLVDAVQQGYHQEMNTIAYVSATQFTVATDQTGLYTAGRILRFNQDDTKIGIVSSASYNGVTGLTTVTIGYGTVPSTLTAVELAILPKGAANVFATLLGITDLPLTTPKVTTGIKDANGNLMAGFNPTASAVNRVGVTNAATGGKPKVAAEGSDANIPLRIEGKGTKGVELKDAVPVVTALADGVNIPTDASLGNYFTVTLAGNRTMDAPTNPTDGQTITYEIKQDATGGRTLTWASAAGGFSFGSGSAPTLSTGASKVDLVGFRYSATVGKWLYLGSQTGF